MAEQPATGALDAPGVLEMHGRLAGRRWPAGGRPVRGRPGPRALKTIIGLAQRLDLRLRPAPRGRPEEVLRGGGGQDARTSSSPGAGPRSCRRWRRGRPSSRLGDSNHPLKITEKGRDALILFATDTRCSYANIVVRKELFDQGVKTVEALADEKLVGRKAVVAATAIGSGTHVYGVYVLQNIKAGDGKAGQRPRGVGGRGRLHHHARRPQGGQVRRHHGGAGVAVGGGGGGLRQAHLRHPGREGVEPRLRRAHPGHGGLLPEGNRREVARPRPGLRQRLLPGAAVDPPRQGRRDRRPALEAVHGRPSSARWCWSPSATTGPSSTGTSWSRRRTTTRGEKVWVPTALDKPIPYAQAVDMSFVQKAQAKYKS